MIHVCLLFEICLAYRLIQQTWHANLLGELLGSLAAVMQ